VSAFVDIERALETAVAQLSSGHDAAPNAVARVVGLLEALDGRTLNRPEAERVQELYRVVVGLTRRELAGLDTEVERVRTARARLRQVATARASAQKAPAIGADCDMRG